MSDRVDGQVEMLRMRCAVSRQNGQSDLRLRMARAARTGSTGDVTYCHHSVRHVKKQNKLTKWRKPAFRTVEVATCGFMIA